jgi:hypothetical protein
MDDFRTAAEAVRVITAGVVARHREARVLTWALLHQIEAEVLQKQPELENIARTF